MTNIKKEDIEKIKNGDIFIFPTETVLGLGVIFGTDTSGIYKLKGRDFKKPLSLHMTKELNYLRFWCNSLPKWIKILIDDVAPGPYTFIYYKNNDLLPEFPYEKIGLRFPDDETFKFLISQLDSPIWGTSVNFSGSPETLDIAEVPQKISESVCCMIQGSNYSKKVRQASTVLDLTENKIDKMVLRKGSGDIKIIEQYWRKFK